jgi:Ni2+-binding GTPase involved in maturation of urease and hydrogenase
MAVTHSAALRNTIATAVLTAIDAGGAAAKLVFRLTGTVGSPGTAVATLTLSDPAGTVTGAVLTFDAITSDTNATGNASPVAAATLQTSADTVCVHCAVAASASDINMTGGLTVGAGDTVSCSSLTYTAPT